MFKKNLLKDIRNSSSVTNSGSGDFEACSKRYAELIRNKEFSQENLEELHKLQKDMLSIMLSDL